MKEIMFEGLSEVTDSVMSMMRQWERFHLVLDLSILDPVYVPGLRQKSYGGLSLRELLYVLQRLKKVKNLASIDCIFDAEPEEQTTLICAKILAEML